MSSIIDSGFPAIVSAKPKTTPMRRAHRHSGALLFAACFALGCSSEPEASVFPACDGAFDVPSWQTSFAANSVEGLAIDPQGAILFAMRAAVETDSFKQELVKLDARGAMVWKQSIPSSDINWLTTNDTGDVFVGGTAISGYDTPPSIDEMPIPGGPFMARLHADGTLMWLHSDKQLPHLGSAGPSLPLLFGQDGQLLAFGSNVVTSLDPDSGDLLWRGQINYELGTFGPSFKSATVDANGDIWAAGFFEGTIEAGGFNVTSAVDHDGFLAHFSSSGTVLGLESFGENTSYAINAIAAYPSGGVLLAKPSASKTSFEQRNADGTIALKWERANDLMVLELGTDNAIYASGIDSFQKGEPMFLEELGRDGALKWHRTFPLEIAEIRALPACRASALIAAPFVAEGTDFGLGKVHCPEGRGDCVVVAISRP